MNTGKNQVCGKNPGICGVRCARTGLLLAFLKPPFPNICCLVVSKQTISRSEGFSGFRHIQTSFSPSFAFLAYPSSSGRCCVLLATLDTGPYTTVARTLRSGFAVIKHDVVFGDAVICDERQVDAFWCLRRDR